MGFQKSTRVFFCKYVRNICSFVAVSQDANSQEDTVPAPEAASATLEDVKDVGGGLVGDFVARWWITMDHLVTGGSMFCEYIRKGRLVATCNTC